MRYSNVIGTEWFEGKQSK